MKPITELVLASHNAGKLKELQAMLGQSVQLRSIGEFSSVEPEETGLSFVENAILKARNAARISGLPALADDSGLAVDFLGGAPGIYSARYADGKGDADGREHESGEKVFLACHFHGVSSICGYAGDFAAVARLRACGLHLLIRSPPGTFCRYARGFTTCREAAVPAQRRQ